MEWHLHTGMTVYFGNSYCPAFSSRIWKLWVDSRNHQPFPRACSWCQHFIYSATASVSWHSRMGYERARKTGPRRVVKASWRNTVACPHTAESCPNWLSLRRHPAHTVDASTGTAVDGMESDRLEPWDRTAVPCPCPETRWAAEAETWRNTWRV